MKLFNQKTWLLAICMGMSLPMMYSQVTVRGGLANPTPGRPAYVDVMLVDLNNDGLLDIYATEESVVIGGPFSQVEVEDDIFINNGVGINPLAGAFATGTLRGTSLLFDRVNARDAATGDFDGDGNMDIVRVSTNEINVIWGTGNGTFSAATQLNSTDPNTALSCPPNYFDVEVADFNNDGRPDIVVAQNNNCGCNPFYQNLGTRNFQVICNQGNAINTKAVSAGDFNADGIQDLIFGHAQAVHVFRGNGIFGFALHQIINNTQGFNWQTVDADFAQMDNDAALDIVITRNNIPNNRGRVEAHFNRVNSFNNFRRKWAKNYDWTISDIRFERNRTNGAEGFRVNNSTEFVVLGTNNNNMNARRVNSRTNIVNISNNFLNGRTSGAGIDFGDLDNDGDLDMVVANGSFIHVYENTYTTGPAVAPPPITSRLKSTTQLESEKEVNLTFYPNPVKGNGNFKYTIGEDHVSVSLEIFDLSGKKVRTLMNNILNEGDYTIDFNTSDLPSGIYYYRFEAGSTLITDKIMVTR